MFPRKYFTVRYWAARYWPKVGLDPTGTTFGCSHGMAMGHEGYIGESMATSSIACCLENYVEDYSEKLDGGFVETQRMKSGFVAAEKGC